MSSNLVSNCSNSVSTNAVSSCGLDRSEVLGGGFRLLGGDSDDPLAVIGLAAFLDGVTAGVTLRGKAAEEGGGMRNGDDLHDYTGRVQML